jgi:hypothetical protein
MMAISVFVGSCHWFHLKRIQNYGGLDVSPFQNADCAQSRFLGKLKFFVTVVSLIVFFIIDFV